MFETTAEGEGRVSILSSLPTQGRDYNDFGPFGSPKPPELFRGDAVQPPSLADDGGFRRHELYFAFHVSHVNARTLVDYHAVLTETRIVPGCFGRRNTWES